MKIWESYESDIKSLLSKKIDLDNNILSRDDLIMVNGNDMISENYQTDLVSLKRKYPFAGDFIEILHDATDKIKFSDSTKNISEMYVFNEKDSSCINSSDENARKWITEILSRKGDMAALPVVLTGPVGSGKSTFMRYIISNFEDNYAEKKVIPSRIEYRRFVDSLPSEYRKMFLDNIGRVEGDSLKKIEPLFDKFILKCMLRDIFFYIDGRKWGAKYHNMSLRDMVERKVSSLKGNSTHTVNRIKSQTDYELVFSSISDDYSHANLSKEFDNVRIEFASLLIDSVESVGYKFQIIFDGFDTISPNDLFLQNANSVILDTLRDFVIRKDYYEFKSDFFKSSKTFVAVNRFKSVKISPLKVVVLRENTHRALLANSAYAIPKPASCDFTAPEFSQIWEKRTRYMLSRILKADNLDLDSSDQVFKKSTEDLVAQYKNIENKIISHLARNSSIKSPLVARSNLDQVFNCNFRACLHFMWHLLTASIEDLESTGRIYAIMRIKKSSSYNVMFSIISNIENIILTRPYFIYRIFMVKDRRMFDNWLQGSPRPSGDQCQISGKYQLFENNFSRGFFDNVFNYFVREKRKSVDGNLENIQCALINIRILQIICYYTGKGRFKEKDGIYEDQIYSHLCANFPSYAVGLDIFRSIMISLMYGELICLTSPNPRTATPAWAITSMGQILIESIVHNFNYIENALLKTIVPLTVATRLKRYNKPSGSLPWYADSIPNCYLFALYIRHEEIKSRKLSNSQEIQEDVLDYIDSFGGMYENIIAHLKETAISICKSEYNEYFKQVQRSAAEVKRSSDNKTFVEYVVAKLEVFAQKPQ